MYKAFQQLCGRLSERRARRPDGPSARGRPGVSTGGAREAWTVPDLGTRIGTRRARVAGTRQGSGLITGRARRAGRPRSGEGGAASGSCAARRRDRRGSPRRGRGRRGGRRVRGPAPVCDGAPDRFGSPGGTPAAPSVRVRPRGPETGDRNGLGAGLPARDGATGVVARGVFLRRPSGRRAAFRAVSRRTKYAVRPGRASPARRRGERKPGGREPGRMRARKDARSRPSPRAAPERACRGHGRSRRASRGAGGGRGAGGTSPSPAGSPCARPPPCRRSPRCRRGR